MFKFYKYKKSLVSVNFETDHESKFIVNTKMKNDVIK